MGREQIVLAHQAEHPLAGNPDVATDPKPSPDLAVALALPGHEVGFDRHQQRLVRDRGLPQNDALPAALGVLAGGHGAGPDPRRRRPEAVGQTRAGRGGGTSPRPRPQRAEWSPSWSSSTCMVNCPIRFMGYPVPAPDRARRRSRRYGSRISTPTARQSPARHAKAAERPHACAPPSIAGQVPAGLPATWPGENVDGQARAFTTGPSTALSSQNYRSRSSLDTSIKPILCPSGDSANDDPRRLDTAQQPRGPDHASAQQDRAGQDNEIAHIGA